MTDRVAEVLPMQDIMDDATGSKLSGKGGVFVGGHDDLAAAQSRYEALKAVEEGTATSEQLQLLRDLDRVLQGARSEAQRQSSPVRPPVPPPVSMAPRYQAPQVIRQPVQATPGMPRPPRHSRNR